MPVLDTRSMHGRGSDGGARPGGEQTTLAEAMNALGRGDLEDAEAHVRTVLSFGPDNVEAMRLLAAVASARGILDEAENLLRRAISLAPDFVAAHADLVSLLCRLARADEGIALLDEAATRHPDAVWPLSLKAAVFSAERRAEEALDAHEQVMRQAPTASLPWMNYAHALQTVGRTEEAVAAYRHSLRLDPANGAAWWGLANLRTVRLSAEDAASMEQILPGVSEPFQKVQLRFALGRALGDLGNFERSFRYYEEANRLRGTLVPYDAASTTKLTNVFEAAFTPDFIAGREGHGCQAEDPIFIVGMPRSGSTLVEQILASHPLIEGAGELFELRELAVRIAGRDGLMGLPDALAGIDVAAARAIGEEYLHAVRRHRRTSHPYFTDKMPSNWQLVPFIRLILPKARIIDVRRDPRACCFSAFTTYFNRQTAFPTSLPDLARYYRDYARLMAHMGAVPPDRIIRVDHESVVADLEREVRHLLDFLGLPFDGACLRFHETQRPIHTPSAQQVRRPINHEAADRWRNYEPWLKPLCDELDVH